jgi:hypothetical protein
VYLLGESSNSACPTFFLPAFLALTYSVILRRKVFESKACLSVIPSVRSNRELSQKMWSVSTSLKASRMLKLVSKHVLNAQVAIRAPCCTFHILLASSLN